MATTTYQETYQQWQNDPEAFWANAAEEIDWYKKWDKVLDDSNPPMYRWFVGAEVNTCYNALDRHVERGRAEPVGPWFMTARSPIQLNATPTVSCGMRWPGLPG